MKLLNFLIKTTNLTFTDSSSTVSISIHFTLIANVSVKIVLQTIHSLTENSSKS